MNRLFFALIAIGFSFSVAAQAAKDPSKDAPTQEVISPAGDVVEYRDPSVFGARLFASQVIRTGKGTFNPQYVVSIGDVITVRMWGAVASEAKYTVDPQGNIFLPNVGPVRVAGVTNSQLSTVVEQSTKSIFKSNVFVYANLEAAQPVKVFVTGAVNKPGLYDGVSSDSVLTFLQSAGGIDQARGSFIDIQVKRFDAVRAQVNLYHFLVGGHLPLVQFTDGDVIVVGHRASQVKVDGDVINASKFEFHGGSERVSTILSMAQVRSSATNFSVRSQVEKVERVAHYPLSKASEVEIHPGDQIWVSTETSKESIGVQVSMGDGSTRMFTAKVGQNLQDLISGMNVASNMDVGAIQVMRKSVANRQAQMLKTTLEKLEAVAYTTRSATADEAVIRTREAELISKFVERAKQVKPIGQVVISDGARLSDIVLEDGDVVVIPQKTSLVLVQGEVNFPSAMVYRSGKSIDSYIGEAGGYSPSANSDQVLVMRRSGAVVRGESANLVAGDEIFVMPKVDSKNMETAKTITQIMYQIAVSAKVVFGL